MKSVTNDIFEDLLAVYAADEAYSIMAMASLKVLKPSIPLSRMSTHYKRTFVCKDYPGAAMSQNHLGELLQRIGKNGNKPNPKTEQTANRKRGRPRKNPAPSDELL